MKIPGTLEHHPLFDIGQRLKESQGDVYFLTLEQKEKGGRIIFQWSQVAVPLCPWGLICLTCESVRDTYRVSGRAETKRSPQPATSLVAAICGVCRGWRATSSRCHIQSWLVSGDIPTYKVTLQSYLMLSHFALLYFMDVAFLTNGRQDPPATKRLRLALLRSLVYWDFHFVVVVWNRACNIPEGACIVYKQVLGFSILENRVLGACLLWMLFSLIRNTCEWREDLSEKGSEAWEERFLRGSLA